MKQFTLVIFILTVMSFSDAEEKKLIEYHKRNELNWEDYHARPSKFFQSINGDQNHIQSKLKW